MTRRIWLAGLAVTLVIAGIATTGGAREPRHQRSDEAKGLVFEGLERKANGACARMYRIELGERGAACTHGPDPAPRGIDVRDRRSVADITQSTQQVTDQIGASGVWCTGDGADGSRVQAVYAVASDRPDRFAEIAPLIATWTGQMDTVVNHSAAETGGERHIRFVTTPGCVLDVAHAVLSPTGDDTLSNTITELRAAGLNRTDRKYMVWADATVYCGIGQVGGGDTAGLTNGANKGPHYARVDSGCWARTDHLSEVHELMHTLGAVQLSAPHSTGGYHCTDESDLMCYRDSASSPPITNPCPSAHEWLLDCNHDDYFHTSPPAGSYLETHWNVATSVFLATGGGDGGAAPTSPSPAVSPSPSPPPTTLTTTTSLGGSLSSKRSTKTFALDVGDGSVVNSLRFGTKGKDKTPSTLRLRILDQDGSVEAEASGPSVVKLNDLLTRGRYTWEVSGSTNVSFRLTITYVTP